MVKLNTGMTFDPNTQ